MLLTSSNLVQFENIQDQFFFVLIESKIKLRRLTKLFVAELDLQKLCWEG
jgi:hypothetical protein